MTTLQSSRDAFQKIRKNPKQRRLADIGIAVLVFAAIAPFVSPPKSSNAASHHSAPSARGGCQSASGNIWSGVKVYSDSECRDLSGFILKARSGTQTIELLLEDGDSDWYSRDDVKRLYVKGGDPAIEHRQLILEK